MDEFGNQLPYLDSVVFTIMSSQHLELEEFKKGNLDMIYRLPAESIKEMVEENIAAFQQKPPKYILERGPELTTQYYELNTQSGIFSNKKVRQAISFAIDRKKIIEDILKGEAWGPGTYGMSPPSFKGYDVSKVKGYDFDIAKAKKLLAEAGYPDGKGFPKVTVQLNSGGKRHTNVVLEIVKQLKENLNVDLDFSVISLSQKLEDSRSGKMEMSRAGWTADYPSPENFLMLFYGRDVPDSAGMPSYPNTSRYKNSEFDKLYEAGMVAANKDTGYAYFLQAEQLMINDAPVIVLWYEEAYRLLQYKVRNFHNNPMQYRDCSIVYFAVPEGAAKPKH
jgi:peptide/nickel transport system substrate-binding protein